VSILAPFPKISVISTPRDKYEELTSDNAGVVWIKDSEIRNAHTAIATKGSGELITFDYFGGLVMIDNSHFKNNGRAIEFMKYPHPNNSYFELGSIVSDESNPSQSDQGVSIWACQDIRFETVSFTGLREFGIFGIDFNATVENCNFNGIAASAGNAIRIETTSPNSVLNRTVIDNCEFQNYRFNFTALSTSSLINRLLNEVLLLTKKAIVVQSK
jgi:hypothetical protein